MAYLYLIAIIFVLYLMMQNKTRGMNKAIEKLVRQSARYAVAAQQDASPVIAILKDIASESQIHNATGIDVKKFKEHVTNVQDMVTRRTSEKCPDFVGEVDIYLAQIGGEAA